MLKFHSNCYTEVSLMVSFQFDCLFLMSFLKLRLLDLVLNFLLSSRGGGGNPSKYLLLQGLTFSENWVMVRCAVMRLLFLSLAKINILMWRVLLKKCKSFKMDSFGRNLSHVELLCWIRAVSVESVLAVQLSQEICLFLLMDWLLYQMYFFFFFF